MISVSEKKAKEGETEREVQHRAQHHGTVDVGKQRHSRQTRRKITGRKNEGVQGGEHNACSRPRRAEGA